MTLTNLLLPFLWVLNGLLAVLYLLVDHALGVLLLPLVAWLTATAQKAQQRHTLLASLLALAAALLASPVVGIFLLLMTGMGIAAIRDEKFNVASRRWSIAGGIALYALIGLGAWGYATLTPWLTDPTLVQGQNYINTIIALALWLFPIGFLGLLAQAMWVHPPLEGTPEDLIVRTRTRGHTR